MLQNLYFLQIPVKMLENLLVYRVFSCKEGSGRMALERVCKTVHQYSKNPIPPEDMTKLLEIAQDAKRVKNYVYERFGGIGGLAKLYPGYTVQNEMTGSGLRAELELPSVYFYLAIFDALGDIKSQWTRTKTKLTRQISRNENLTEEEKHYLRFVIKVSNAFEAALNQKPVKLAGELQKQYEGLEAQVDGEKLRRYLCSRTRKAHVKLHTDAAEGFSIAERVYRYAGHGIYIYCKTAREVIL